MPQKQYVCIISSMGNGDNECILLFSILQGYLVYLYLNWYLDWVIQCAYDVEHTRARYTFTYTQIKIRSQ